MTNGVVLLPLTNGTVAVSRCSRLMRCITRSNGQCTISMNGSSLVTRVVSAETGAEVTPAVGSYDVAMTWVATPFPLSVTSYTRNVVRGTRKTTVARTCMLLRSTDSTATVSLPSVVTNAARSGCCA
jgi:hypothetical protein